MTLTIVLPPILETRLREQAAEAGVDAADYVLKALELDLLRTSGAVSGRLSAEDSRLLRDINAGLNPEQWARYRMLARRGRAEKLSARDQEELVELSGQIETANSRRLSAAVAYARSNGKSLKDVLKQFDIGELANV